MPGKKGIDVAEEKVAGLGLFARFGDVIEQPADFEGAEIGGERESGLRAEAVGSPVAGEFGDRFGDPHILPDESVGHGFAGVAIPQDGGFALVGDSDGGQAGGLEAALRHGFRDDCARAEPDLVRVVLHPSGLRIDLLVLFLGAGDDASATVENQKTCAGGALIDGADEVCHNSLTRGLSSLASHRGFGAPG